MKEIQDTVRALRKQMEDIDKKDKEEEKKEQNKDDEDDDGEEEPAHALLKKEKGDHSIQILLQTKDGQNATATQAKSSTTEAKSNATAAAPAQKEEKAGRFERFLKAQKQKQETAKTLEAMAKPDQPAAPAPAGTNATNSNQGPIRELVIVQDFHQARSIPGSLGENTPAPSQPAPVQQAVAPTKKPEHPQ